MNRITNTTKIDPLVQLLVTVSGFGGIERQEAKGQAELVQSEVLPTEIGIKDKKVLELAGVVFGKAVDGDEIFTNVKLPAGWQKVPTGHSMWSELKDDKGRVRASIFYKAAFYDRHAFIRCDCRIRLKYADDGKYDVVKDDVIIFKGCTGYEESRKQCEDWLRLNYPNWQDPAGYWDID
jgi:hypothetical protein